MVAFTNYTDKFLWHTNENRPRRVFVVRGNEPSGLIGADEFDMLVAVRIRRVRDDSQFVIQPLPPPTAVPPANEAPLRRCNRFCGFLCVQLPDSGLQPERVNGIPDNVSYGHAG